MSQQRLYEHYEPVFRELSDLVVFENHVALRSELADNSLLVGRGDVDDHRALVAIRAQIVSGLARVRAVGVFG